ncbi:uncharacterized protein E0L32_004267 [Thyridium curvatum]|uniref:Uncharacterized protein n=1 Tax=Thyridium curvatum TaxID=1093900 RepID=A0A507BE61_9PEZI|nr:uncharacterized protein E0L32_004267 [Thyridium curvatum]TPX15569.1 hypothetical protein E0L32_004267 [Thyridium curvatum]
MPVTVHPSNHAAESWGRAQSQKFTEVTSPEQLLRSTLSSDRHAGPDKHASAPPPRPRRLLQNSFAGSLPSPDRPVQGDGTSPALFATKNGLVHACIEAYNNHHNLVIRPEDVWFAILSQLGAHLQADTEVCASLFNDVDAAAAADDDGDDDDATASKQAPAAAAKRLLHIDVSLGEGLDHGAMAVQMSKLLASHLRDPSLRDWFLPAFSTTSRADQAVAAALLMGAARRFFTYSWGTRCGIPAATLLGEADDWALIRARCAERLGGGHLGVAAAAWHRAALAPALDGLLESFRDPAGERARRFWQGVCCEHRPNGSGVTEYSGWITAFCYWDEDGRCLHRGGEEEGGGGGGGRSSSAPRISRGSVPMGFSIVPVVLMDEGNPIQTEMIAGSVGFQLRRSGEETKTGSGSGDGPERQRSSRAVQDRWHGYDTLQPQSGWFMYMV